MLQNIALFLLCLVIPFIAAVDLVFYILAIRIALKVKHPRRLLAMDKRVTDDVISDRHYMCLCIGLGVGFTVLLVGLVKLGLYLA